MKGLNKIWGIALLAFTLILSAPHTSIAQQEGEYISDQEFYDELQPYGTWIYDPQYGNVWIPDVEEDFRPYATRGYWAMTSYGNIWVSDYPWGWATFHYGRWHFDNYYGWEWVPGNEWAPAWVSWRDGGGYYGWAPMEPGVSIDASFGDNYSVPDNYWVFAPYAYINYTNVYNYYVPYNRTRTIIRNTNWLRNRYNYNNRVYNAGPRREEIQRYSHRPVRVYNINNVNRPSRITVNNNIYRPSVRQNINARPARVVDGNAYKQQNPTQRIGSRDRSRGTVYNAANAARLAQAAKASTPDSKVVRVNDDRASVKPARPGAVIPGNANQPGRTNRPAVTGDAQQQQRAIDKQQGNVRQQQMRERREKAQSEATQQQTEQQKQQLEQQRVQQQQAHQQQLEQQKQQREQNPQQPTRPQRTSRPAVTDDGQAQQRQKVLEQQQQEQVRQQQAEQKQQQAQQVRQQQQEQQRSQQAEQHRQQQAQQQQARQQQVEEQRSQQAEQQKQQARQQQEQQRQQQAEQQKEQARQQQEQQRSQQAEQQRQQQAQQQQARQQQAEQQRQQQQPQKQAEPSHRPTRP
jgi:hypothetical protein